MTYDGPPTVPGPNDPQPVPPQQPIPVYAPQPLPVAPAGPARVAGNTVVVVATLFVLFCVLPVVICGISGGFSTGHQFGP